MYSKHVWLAIKHQHANGIIKINQSIIFYLYYFTKFFFVYQFALTISSCFSNVNLSLCLFETIASGVITFPAEFLFLKETIQSFDYFVS